MFGIRAYLLGRRVAERLWSDEARRVLCSSASWPPHTTLTMPSLSPTMTKGNLSTFTKKKSLIVNLTRPQTHFGKVRNTRSISKFSVVMFVVC